MPSWKNQSEFKNGLSVLKKTDWSSVYLKDEQKKRWRMKLLLMQVLYRKRKKIIVFWQHHCIFEIKIINWYKTDCSWMLKKIINYFSKTNFYCVWRFPLNTLKLFSSKCFIIFSTFITFFLPIQEVYPKNPLTLSQKDIFYCKALLNPPRLAQTADSVKSTR